MSDFSVIGFIEFKTTALQSEFITTANTLLCYKNLGNDSKLRGHLIRVIIEYCVQPMIHAIMGCLNTENHSFLEL